MMANGLARDGRVTVTTCALVQNVSQTQTHGCNSGTVFLAILDDVTVACDSFSLVRRDGVPLDKVRQANILGYWVVP